LVDKRYQVFVSSTYADLKDERQAVIRAVMELDCIPAGMELFPAADEEQFEFIKRVINDCDYYLLIIGGRYGSVTETGISYTEQEYDYAVKRGLKVIALLHENPDEIPLGKSEKDPALRERLRQFKEKVSTGRLVKFWKGADDLPGKVALSLSQTIKIHPAVGWVRANRAANEQILTEINELRKQNAKLEVALANVAQVPSMEGLAGLDEEVTVLGRYYDTYYKRDKAHSVQRTWRKIFGLIGPYLVAHPNHDLVKITLQASVFHPLPNDATHPKIEDQFFETIAVQLKALGLVEIAYTEAVGGGMGLFWSLTPAGERLMMEVRAIRSAQTTVREVAPPPK
jgi:hypothetical protein